MENLELSSAQSQEAQAALMTSYCALQTAVLVIDRPEAYQSALKAFYASYDAYIAIVNAQMKPKCRSGCGYCCYDNPHGVSGAELLYIYEMIREDPRYDEWKEELELRTRQFQVLKQTEGMTPIQIRWKKTKKPCVFLGKDQRCNIYERRPVACRMFFSITPPEMCHPDHQNHDKAINPHLEPSSAIKEFLKKISSIRNVSDLPKDFISGMHILMTRMEP